MNGHTVTLGTAESPGTWVDRVECETGGYPYVWFQRVHCMIGRGDTQRRGERAMHTGQWLTIYGHT